MVRDWNHGPHAAPELAYSSYESHERSQTEGHHNISGNPVDKHMDSKDKSVNDKRR